MPNLTLVNLKKNLLLETVESLARRIRLWNTLDQSVVPLRLSWWLFQRDKPVYAIFRSTWHSQKPFSHTVQTILLFKLRFSRVFGPVIEINYEFWIFFSDLNNNVAQIVIAFTHFKVQGVNSITISCHILV